MSKNENVELLDSYNLVSNDIPIEVKIIKKDEFTPTYVMSLPGIGEYTKLMLETKLRGELISLVKIELNELLDPKKIESTKKKYFEGALQVVEKNFPNLPENKKKILASYLIQYTLGLGDIEFLLADPMLEEIVVNNSKDPVWVYHKSYGWCKTNLYLKSEEHILDYSSLIARKVGKQINILNPLLDAHLSTGDRVNATLFPISHFGNTLTIRKFSKNPWTITTLISNKMVNSELAALLWLAIENELSLIIAGGTGSGKTSFLNALAAFIPANQRIISIEDTRELTLPSFLHWVPLVTREPNAEGKGEVSMLDLLINSLRMRPDRILVGEIRRQREAEILFEAMHTGHSVYATLHADNVEQAISRLTNPPINIPKEMLDAVAGIVVTFRNRQTNIRRVLEFGEIHKNGNFKITHRYIPKEDVIKQVSNLQRLIDSISLYTGWSEKEINQDLSAKKTILEWMVENKYFLVDQVGKIVSLYYVNKEKIFNAALKGEKLNV